jgi:hypothetical protein
MMMTLQCIHGSRTATSHWASASRFCGGRRTICRKQILQYRAGEPHARVACWGQEIGECGGERREHMSHE